MAKRGQELGIAVEARTARYDTLIPNWLILQGCWPKDKRLERAERNVLEVLHMHLFGRPSCFVSYHTIASEAGVSESYVKRHAMPYLEELELVTVKSDGKPKLGEHKMAAVNTYYVAIEPPTWLIPQLEQSRLWQPRSGIGAVAGLILIERTSIYWHSPFASH